MYICIFLDDLLSFLLIYFLIFKYKQKINVYPERKIIIEYCINVLF